MTVPVILVNGSQPPPLGSKTNGTIALGTTSVTLSLQSTTGIGSVEWSVSKATGSTTAVASASPTSPFSTTLGPFDVVGTYLVQVIANGNAAGDEIAEVALTVVSPMNGHRIPAVGEEAQWDPTTQWEDAIRDLALHVDAPGVATVAMGDANQTLVAADYRNETIKCTGALTADRSLVLPLVSGARRTIHNATTGGYNIVVKKSGGTGVSVPSGMRQVYCDGSDWAGDTNGASGTTAQTIGSDTTLVRAPARFVSVEGLGAAITVTLPASPTSGDRISFGFDTTVSTTNRVTINGNGKAISSASTRVVTTPLSWMVIEYTGTTWRVVSSTFPIVTRNAVDANHTHVYYCDEVSGTTLANSGAAGSGANLTLAGTYQLANRGLFPNGTNSVLWTAAGGTDGATVSSQSISTGTAFSLEAVIDWMHVPGTFGGVVAEFSDNSRTMSILLAVAGSAASSPNQVQAYLACSSLSVSTALSIGVTNLGGRTYLGLSRSGTTFQMYMNGAMVTSTTIGSASSFGTATKIAIGNNTAGAQAYRGRIAEVRFSNVARNASYFLSSYLANEAL